MAVCKNKDRVAAVMELTGTKQNHSLPDSDSVLTEEQLREGLFLEEEEDFLFLHCRDGMKAVFSTQGATVQAIREEANRILCENRMCRQ